MLWVWPMAMPNAAYAYRWCMDCCSLRTSIFILNGGRDSETGASQAAYCIM